MTASRWAKLTLLVALTLVATLAPTGATGDPPRLGGSRSATEAALQTSPAALRFGIYPGGAVGKVGGGPNPEAFVEDTATRLAALRRLQGDRELVLHLYADWTGTQAPQDATRSALAEVDAYVAEGFAAEAVVRYRPTDDAGPLDDRPTAFADHVG